MALDVSECKALLYTAVLSDIMDDMGLMNHAMGPVVRPIDDDLVMMGRARTGLCAPVSAAEDGKKPYEVEIALMDDLKAGEVLVIACNGPTDHIAPWGELLSTAARCQGAVGCVTDGLVRDVRKIREMRFPVFHGGICPLDSRGRGRMVEMDVPVDCAGARVCPGDLLFGDADGVVVIPQARVEEVVDRAKRKITGENHTRTELLQGHRLRDIYAKYGVL